MTKPNETEMVPSGMRPNERWVNPYIRGDRCLDAWILTCVVGLVFLVISLSGCSGWEVRLGLADVKCVGAQCLTAPQKPLD